MANSRKQPFFNNGIVEEWIDFLRSQRERSPLLIERSEINQMERVNAAWPAKSKSTNKINEINLIFDCGLLGKANCWTEWNEKQEVFWMKWVKQQPAGRPGRSATINSHLSLITQLKKFSWLMEEMELLLLRHGLRSLIHLICLHSHSAKTIHQFSSRVHCSTNSFHSFQSNSKRWMNLMGWMVSLLSFD